MKLSRGSRLAILVLLLALTRKVDDTPPGPPVPPPVPVNPAPVKEPGFRVLFLYEKDDLDKYTLGQQDAFTFANKAIDQYTAEKCVKVNGTPERRSWDDDQDVSKDTKTMQDMRKAADVTNLPQLVISNGTTGYVGKAPDTAEKILDLLDDYGG